jgi:hypothetical protein
MHNSKEGECPADDTSSASDANSRTRERYAALRNHQIRFEDAIDPNAERVYKLNKSDVVFGRGRGSQDHSGNQRMRDMIEKYKTQYHSLKREGKRKLVESVYKEITYGGGRFLKKLDSEDIWVVVDRPIALQKVSHTMRCRKSIIENLDGDGQVPEAAGRPSSMPVMKHSNITDAKTISNRYANPGPGVWSLHGAVARTSAAGFNPMNMLLPPSVGNSLAGIEAQCLAALDRYRTLPGMAPVMPTGMGYYEMLRREQVIRDMMLYQQMGDAVVLNSAFEMPNLVASSPSQPPLPNQVLSAPSALRKGILPDSPDAATCDSTRIRSALWLSTREPL